MTGIIRASLLVPVYAFVGLVLRTANDEDAAYSNVCFSAEHVPLDELKRFHVDVEKRLEGEVDLTTIDWIWQRLAETGPSGREYRRRFEPQYRANLDAALAEGKSGQP